MALLVVVASLGVSCSVICFMGAASRSSDLDKAAPLLSASAQWALLSLAAVVAIHFGVGR